MGMLCIVLKVLLLLFVTESLSNQLIFSSEKDVYRFYEQWTNSKSREEFQNIQNQYMTLLMKTSVDPCENFYEFACGNFGSLITSDNTWSRKSVPYLLNSSLKHLKGKLLESKIAANDLESTIKLKTFYQSCIDGSAWRREELANFIKNFASWPMLQPTPSDKEFDWLNVTAYSARYKIFGLFSINTVVNDGIYRAMLSSSFDNPFTIMRIKEKANRLSINLNGKERDLEAVTKFFFKLVAIHNKYFLRSQPVKLRQSSLRRHVRGVDFRRYLQILRGKRRLSPNEQIILNGPLYFQELSTLISRTDPRVIANYILIRWINKAIELLEEVRQAPLKIVCDQFVQNFMHPAYTGLFAQTYYDRKSHTKIGGIVRELQEAALRVTNTSDLLTPNLKTDISNKINNIKKNIGIPDHIQRIYWLKKEYRNLQLDRSNFIRNFLNVVRLMVANSQKKVGYAHRDFFTDPTEITAFFSAQMNNTLEITAGLLQPPFFHKYSPMFVNYGGIGSIVGHEFVHSFEHDNWLESGSIFSDRIRCFVSQYSQYDTGNVSLRMSGERTLKENIADNLGMKISLSAYKKWLERNNETSRIQHKGRALSPVQSFFVAFAQLYCEIYTDSLVLKWDLLADEHSPGPMRITGALSNSRDFAEAFNCPVGSKMNPERKCKYLRK